MKATTITKETTTEIDSTTNPTRRTMTSFSKTESGTTSEDKETTSIPVTEHKPSEITMATTEWRSPGNDKVIDRSRDESSGRSTTVVVVSVLCALAAVAAMSVATVCLVRKWKRPRKAIINDESNIQIEKPENQVYQTQDNIYQLLQRDGKSTGCGQWEPPAYQGLAKGATGGDWGDGEVYTNPSMYQDLTKNEAAYLPAYHPLVKQLQSTTDNGPEYDSAGYLVLVGEHGKEEETADVEDPYYYKVEQMIE
ncbi:hypothetical protein OS493_034907 [Desmophyllum pertusum]|uniref:Uncharacterized protein n=1 Tax=Desmophyllum pertusum TaxID=174260 RepID=A0A9W9Z7N4_9CNID|nr:hypothetical protein OS493_034907 [Desmophyllum pertusum]